MSRRRDMVDALTGRIPERVPTWELQFHLWQKFTDSPFIVGAPFSRLSHGEQERQIGVNAEVMVDVADRLGFAGITLPAWYWESAPGQPSFCWLPEWARERLFRRLCELARDQFFFVVHTGGVLGMPPARRYVEFSYLLFDDPESIDRAARERCDGGKRQVARWAELGADGYLMPSDLATNSGPFYSPEQMKRFVYPYLSEMADTIRAAGGHSILHTDGDIMPLIADIAATGVDAVQALDPVAGMRLDRAKSAVGDRLTLCGNVDCCAILAGTPEEVRAATLECLDRAAGGGRFVLGASNVVEYEAPAENFLAMVDAWREFEQQTGTSRAETASR